jgi:hypothetical protein
MLSTSTEKLGPNFGQSALFQFLSEQIAYWLTTALGGQQHQAWIFLHGVTYQLDAELHGGSFGLPVETFSNLIEFLMIFLSPERSPG